MPANTSCGRPSHAKVRARQKRFLPQTQHNSTVVSYTVRCKWTPPTHAYCTSRSGIIWAQPTYHVSCFVPSASHRFSVVHVMRCIAGRRKSGLSLQRHRLMSYISCMCYSDGATHISRHLNGLGTCFVVVEGVVLLCSTGGGDEVENAVVATVTQR